MKGHIIFWLYKLFACLLGILIAVVTATVFSFGQDLEPDFGHFMEEIIFDPDEDFDPEIINEVLISLYHRPVDLNSTHRSDFEKIPFLKDREIEAILSFRNDTGPFLSRHELYLIEGLDSARADLLFPFVKISDQNSLRDTLSLFRNLFKTSRKSMILRYGRTFQSQQGFLNKKHPSPVDEGQYFVGTRDYIYGRLEVHEPGDFDVGLTFEKDPGEAFFVNRSLRSYGFDHYAGYLRLLDRGRLRECVIGNFQLHYGEGLVFGRGYNRKGTETIGAVRNRYSGVHPYQGASETGSFRGAAWVLGNRRWSGAFFFSANSLDAALVRDTLESGEASIYMTHFYTNGLHRMPRELKAKKTVAEYAAGYNVQYRSSTVPLSVGSTLAFMHWNLPLKADPTYYNQFQFTGSRMLSGSAYYNFYRGKFNIFGELAMSAGTGKAMVHGIMANILSNFETSLHFRYFSRDYYSKFGKSFSEFTGNNNEAGIYWGFRLMPIKWIEIRTYLDIFRTIWMRYNMAGPSYGQELFLEVRYQPKSSISLRSRYKKEVKGRNLQVQNHPVRGTSEGVKRNLQFLLESEPTKGLKLKTRLLGSTFYVDGILTRGFCISQDLGYERQKLTVNARLAYFSTDDYSNRQYIYEHDVLYAYQVPAYQGHGLRTYLLVKYSPLVAFDLWFKVSQYHYFDRDVIGSGLSVIQGNKKTEIKCQIRIKF